MLHCTKNMFEYLSNVRSYEFMYVYYIGSCMYVIWLLIKKIKLNYNRTH